MDEERDPLTAAVIGAAIEVHREMGPGLLESVYQACMEHELGTRGLSFDAQKHLPLVFKGRVLKGDFVMDFFFSGRLVVELKLSRKCSPFTRPNS